LVFSASCAALAVSSMAFIAASVSSGVSAIVS